MIYVVRHGQTDWNVLNKLQGRTDIELNQTGVEQAKELAQKLAGIKFDVCIASPLQRALKTARTIFDGPIQIDERIVERSNGDLEGRTDWKELSVNYYDPNENRFNIETLAEMQNRLQPFWEEILAKYPDQNVLIVTHAGVAIWTQAYFYGLPAGNNFAKYRLNNCEVLQIDNATKPRGFQL